MMKFELLSANGVSAGNVELDPSKINQIERNANGRDLIQCEGGWFYVDLSSEQLAAIYRVLAENAEREAKEKNDAIALIK